MADIQKLSSLKSLGKQSEAMLARAGITTLEQLREMGSIVAYIRAKEVSKNVSLNLLWALESAITGEPWQEIAKNHRTSLLLALDEYQSYQDK